MKEKTISSIVYYDTCSLLWYMQYSSLKVSTAYFKRRFSFSSSDRISILNTHNINCLLSYGYLMKSVQKKW